MVPMFKPLIEQDEYEASSKCLELGLISPTKK